ncbi:MAG: hypothetical protein GY861_11385 [bacterium]|nr:hypothetical protein [bacterium]
MNDFFTSEEEEANKATTEAEALEIRAKIQADVFEGKPADFDDSIDGDESKTKEVVDDEPDDDESADVVEPVDVVEPADDPGTLSPEMQAIVDSVNKLTSSITGMEDRLKQTEKRVGGISNEFHAAKEAAQSQPKAPTPEEMAVAAKNKESWEELKKDFPTWATAIKSKIAEQATNFVTMEDFKELRKSLSDVPSIDTGQLETRLVGFMHPDWKEITKDPEYATWLNAQDDVIKHKAYKGTTAEEAIDVFNRYKSSKANSSSSGDLTPTSEVNEIKERRTKRLKASTTTSTKHKTIKQKSRDEMSEDELRSDIAAEVFDN